jgi:hypothetical protein
MHVERRSERVYKLELRLVSVTIDIQIIISFYYTTQVMAHP